MQKHRRKPFFKRRRYKPMTTRTLSIRDLAVFEFLWLWKVATSQMLAQFAFKGKSQWWIYKALKRLEKENLILRLPRSRNIDQELWTLTEHGFEIFLMDRDDIKSYRYRVHAPSHDFLATCLQLGDYWLTEVDKTYLTEQMLASLAPSNFPKEMREVPEHVPDGITTFNGGIKKATVGYEVDLNLKDDERYVFTQRYYNSVNPALVVWLVKNEWIAKRIRAACEQEWSTTEMREKIVFVLVDDFKKGVWGAQVISGKYKGVSLLKLHANVVQSVGKALPNSMQNQMKDYFFQKYKSPQKLVA